VRHEAFPFGEALAGFFGRGAKFSERKFADNRCGQRVKESESRSRVANEISRANRLTKSAAGRKIATSGRMVPFAASAMIRKALIPNRGFLFYVTGPAGDGIPGECSS
jgi:hypothetical protein